jgi:hypothetical protein
MKFAHVIRGCVVASAMVLGVASIARADDQTVTAKVPFDFMVGGSRMPAGTYVISTVGDNGGMIAIAGENTRKAVYTLTIPLGNKDQTAPPQLAFEKVGGEYVLTHITLEGTDGHRTAVAPVAQKRGTTALAARANY